MFSEWYQWLIFAAVLAVAIVCKIKFLQWWNRRRKEQERRGKWGDDT